LLLLNIAAGDLLKSTKRINQKDNMSKKLINPKELYDGAASGMSQATVETELGLVFVSGQVDWNHQHKTTENSIEGRGKTVESYV
jgi:enamine deaminase RidA (YjgF/YER057c/UK114 family)